MACFDKNGPQFSLRCSFSVHAIHMGEDVLSVFEHAVKVLSRREDLADSRYDVLDNILIFSIH